ACCSPSSVLILVYFVTRSPPSATRFPYTTLFRSRVGPRRQPDVVGGMGAGGPQLVAIDHEAVVLDPGRGFQGGQVGPGARLGVADGEMDLPGGDTRQEAFLLFRRAMLHQRRAYGTDGDEGQRRPGNRSEEHTSE